MKVSALMGSHFVFIRRTKSIPAKNSYPLESTANHPRANFIFFPQNAMPYFHTFSTPCERNAAK